MIEPELVDSAHSILSNVIVSLMEDEHLAVVLVPAKGAEDDHALRLRQLGEDIADIARALIVIRRRSQSSDRP